MQDSRVTPGGQESNQTNQDEVFEMQLEPETEHKTQNKSTCSDCGRLALKVAASLFSGIVLGLALEKARVFNPKTVRNQMVFENFIMLKMFLSAVASGQIFLSILSLIPQTKAKFTRASEEFISCFNHKGFLSTIIGSYVFGVGMVLCGACPAMVFTQVGAVVPNAVFSLLGGLFGALTYGLVAPFIEKTTKPKNPLAVHQIHTKFNLPYSALALPMGVTLAGGVILLEWLWPGSKDYSDLGTVINYDRNIMQIEAWPSYIAGCLVGASQVPLVLVLHDTLGGSSSYATIVSQWVVTEKLQKMFPYLANRRTGIKNWWQVFLIIGATGGAVLSAGLSSTIGSVRGVTVPEALCGGLLMLWGSRFAAGCTSGHGLSGMGLFAWLSFLAVPSMFAGGITTSFLMKVTGVKDNYVTATGDVG